MSEAAKCGGVLWDNCEVHLVGGVEHQSLGNVVWSEGDRDHRRSNMERADNFWLMSEDLENRRNMMNELVTEIQNLGMEPKPKSLWRAPLGKRRAGPCSARRPGAFQVSTQWYGD